MKRFYNNKLMRFAPKGALRFVALLCVLLGFCSSAWAQKKCYVDATAIVADGYSVEISHIQTMNSQGLEKTEEKSGLWSFTCPASTKLKIQVRANKGSSYGDWIWIENIPAYTSNTNCITLTYSSGAFSYKWIERNEFMEMPIYFQPASDWKGANAWFAVYFFDDKNHAVWKKLEPSICDPAAYVTTTPNYADWNWSALKMIFCRMNPASNVLGWSNVWNQTVDQVRNDGWIDDGNLNVFNTGRTWAQIIKPWGKDDDNDPNVDDNKEATIQWYNTSCTEQAEEYSLAGSFNGWSTNKDIFEVGKGASGSVEIELTAGTYEFKILKNQNTWYGCADQITNETTGKEFFTDKGNCSFIAGMDGVYTFTFGENWIEGKTGMWLKVEYGVSKEPVLLASKATYPTATEVKLSAYIQNTYCGDAIDATGGKITEWGFVICPGSANSACTPTKTSAQKYPATRGAKYRGEIFEHTLDFSQDNLIGGAIYGYRGFVKIGGKMYLTKETGTFFFPGDCTQKEIDANKTPIIYTIDASLGDDYADDCNLRYGSLQTALNRLRELAKDKNVAANYKYATYDETNNSLNLNVPIEMHVAYYDNTPDDPSTAYCYEGDTKAGVSGGGTSSENSMALIIKDVNRSLDKDDTRYTLTIKGSSEKTRPWIHHIIVRNSKDVILDNLVILSDPSNKNQDDALEFDCDSKEWHTLTPGKIADANIVVKNCMIGSNGFTGVHASAYDGIIFENNEFEAIMATTGDVDNAVAWGASAKFMACKNIKFIRNNFRGAHATLVWIQDTQNALFMNNVFWNTNQYQATCSAVRLVEQYDYAPSKNIGFYYNTFYLADGKINKDHRYDFLHTSDKGGGESGRFSYVEFMYNNCYSYDTDAPGKSDSEPDNLSNSTLCPNNFWSKNSSAKFAFGSCSGDAANKDIDVSQYVCATTASGPASLVIKGGGLLNVGKKLTKDDIDITGQTISSEEFTYDRYKHTRPDDNTWTFGAYQGKQDIIVKTIYWIGVNEKWDNRNNWGFYASDIVDNSKATNGTSGVTRSAELQRLSCVNNLTNELKVVITENPLVQLPADQKRQWPVIPEEFGSDYRQNATKTTDLPEGIPVAEQVSTPDGKFAHTIEIEYGAALKGVTDLTNGNPHYALAKTSFEAPRSKWVLVGTVVQPKDASEASGYRNLYSRDFYKDRKPQVYMHEATVDENNNVLWGDPFPDMDREIGENEVFAINIPDEYGEYKIPSYYYYQYEEIDATKLNHSEVPINYNYEGRFVRDNEHISVSIEAGKNKLLSNSYPCNLSAVAIEDLGVNVSYYNYAAGTFMPLGASDVQIKPQHGFMVSSTAAKTLTFNNSVYADGNTRSRSAKASMPAFELMLSNASRADGGFSMIIVRHDELKGDTNEPIDSDTEKIFSANAYAPDLYMIMYDGLYSRLHLGKTSQEIPLGIRIKTPMSIRFEQVAETDFTEVTLLDKLTGKKYNLLGRSFTTDQLPAGDLEGRFYLQVSTDDLFPDEEEENGDVSTEVEETTDSNIQIFTDEYQENVIKVITNNVELKTIYVSDMVGHVYTYQVSGNFANLKLPVPAGVYVVCVIGDNASRTEKVILK